MTSAESVDALARAVARYHAGCLRAIGAQNVALEDVRTAKKSAVACDIGWLVDQETLLSEGHLQLAPPGGPGAGPDDAEQKRLVWNRVRELTAKASTEPYAKEIAYAYPLVLGILPRTRPGAGARLEQILAPLFIQSVTASVEQDGTILVVAQDEPLRFNTAVWANALSAGDAGQIVRAGIEAQADLSAEWDLNRVDALTRAIAAVFPNAMTGPPDGSLLPWPEREMGVGMKDASPGLRIFNGAALFLSNRSSQYLLHDLEEIADDPKPFLEQRGPFSVLLRPPSDEARPPLEHPRIDEVVFPFASNQPQRQVADAIEKNNVIVVQGPPGTGKSLTIANLVSHLVAKGRRVLVTSHKPQALKVVRDNLERTGLRFLYASLIGTDAMAKRELAAQIANVQAFVTAAHQSALAERLGDIEERRVLSGAQYAEIRSQFLDKAQPDQAEAASLFQQLESKALLPLADPAIPQDQHEAVANALEGIDHLARRHSGVWAELIRTSLATGEGIDVALEALTTFVDHERARIRAAEDPRVKLLVERWHRTLEAFPDEIDQAREAIATIRASLIPPFSQMCEGPEPDRQRSAAGILATDASLGARLASDVERLQQAEAKLVELADARNAVKCDPSRRAELIQVHLELSSIFRRRRARRWFEAHAPGGLALSTEQVQRWAAFWDTWAAFRETADRLVAGLSEQLPEAFSAEAVRVTVLRTKRASDLAGGIRTSRTAIQGLRIALPIEDAVGAGEAASLSRELGCWEVALQAAEADWLGNALRDAPALAPLHSWVSEADNLIDDQRYDDGIAALVTIDKLKEALPAIAERRRLLDGPLAELPESVREIEGSAIVGDPPPPFLSDPLAALKLQGAAHRFDEIAAAETTRDLAHSLETLTEQLLSDAKELLQCRIQSRIMEGFRRPKFQASLAIFKRAIGASPKRFERFEELKHSPTFDVRVLTDVFPCWIMKPEDACRVFPLAPHVFDVVIFDEASQCNPDQSLPLFARADTVVVFGDDKQLSNEDLRRSLASFTNSALLRQAGLQTLDSTGLFDQTRNSLLELVSRRQEQSVQLNEHFRCRPEIIAFSNDAFYGSTLCVIRDTDDSKGVGPALLIREVLDSGDVGETKINYSEAEALLEELERRLADPRYEGMSFGILSLFREQTEHLAELVESRIPRSVREKYQIICSTVDGFQGEERDVILYSWRFTKSSSPQIFAFTNGEAGRQRMNVALTRARHQAIHFISAPVERFPQGAGYVTGLLRHALDPSIILSRQEGQAHREPDTESRRRIARALEETEMDVRHDFVAGGVGIDLVAYDPLTNARVGVFVDAEFDSRPPITTLNRVDAHALLTRAGWTLERVPAVKALTGPDEWAAEFSGIIKNLPAGSTREVEPIHATVRLERSVLGRDDLAPLARDITPEDRADYAWDPPDVQTRLRAGEDVFQSEFEVDLYDRLSVHDGVTLVPQWPSMGKRIDLVLTDEDGRRLAVEADGEPDHMTEGGALIPEDKNRQELLERAGWVFERVWYLDFIKDPEGQVTRLLEALRRQPANPRLVERELPKASVAPLRLAVGGTTIDSEPPASARESKRPTRAPFREPQEGAKIVPLRGADRKETEPASPDAALRETSLEDAVFRRIAMDIAIVVRERGGIKDADLVRAFAERFGVAVPKARERMLEKFAWSAKGHGFIDLDMTAKLWIPGKKDPHEVTEFGDWSMNTLIARAAQLLPSEPADEVHGHLVEELYPSVGRTPRLAMSLAGTAINAAKKRISRTQAGS